MINPSLFPAEMPQKKILAVDIGGTLAKAAFYVPYDDPLRQDEARFAELTSECVAGKSISQRSHFDDS